MQTLTVSTQNGKYDVCIGSGLLAACGRHIAAVHAPGCAVIVSDDRVNALYGDVCERSLCEAGFSCLRFVFPLGEQSKNFDTYLRLQAFLAENRVTRADLIVALGGGVVGDLAGFAAATYLRGIAYVQLPTTLLAMVDSSVGGKTAVDLPQGKNLCGCFWQPSLVLCDTDALATLPADVFADGMAEVIKYALLGDAALFETLQREDALSQLQQIICRCIEMKRDIVAADTFDRGERQKLNLGHTVGHAIEKCSGYAVSHGCAVAMGLAAMSRAAARLGFAAHSLPQQVQQLLLQYSLPTACPYSAQMLFEAACSDKKVQRSRVTLVVPTGIGSCELVSVPLQEMAAWLEAGAAQ